MKRTSLFGTLILLIATASVVVAQSGSYDLLWNTIDGGGGDSAGDGYTLTGTIGQSDAGAVLGGDGFTLVGGFWIDIDIDAANHHIFLPAILR